MKPSTRKELLNLLEDFLEGNSSQEDISRIEQLVFEDSDAAKLYLEVMQLHGNLYWDAAGCGSEFEVPQAQPAQQAPTTSPKAPTTSPRRWGKTAASLMTACLVLGALSSLIFIQGPSEPNQSLISNSDNVQADNNPSFVDVESDKNSEIIEVHLPQNKNNDLSDSTLAENVKSKTDHLPFDPSSDTEIVSFINDELKTALNEHDIQPSPRADDSEWVRRVHLDLAGRIPTTLEVETFLKDSDANKRVRLLDSLLESQDFASNFASIWTTLLVGRSTDREIDREELYSYLLNQFGNNKPWSNTVSDLIAAKGKAEQSGPANFLLAHLNNEAVPATAITARIFLCQQIQCTQCHRHPTVKDWGQEKFWEFNAFFQKTTVQENQNRDPKSGMMKTSLELVDLATSKVEPAYYEDLQGVMKVAYPRFAEVDVHPMENKTLRDQLAELLTSENDSQLSKAFVNRSWMHFFGHAFTPQVDDMGPHHKVSHPKLLEGMSKAFAENDYDVHRLIRWICLSDAYHYSSSPIAENELDAPDVGELPLFSRMYLKPLSPEQIFNSLIVATGNVPHNRTQRTSTYLQREEWLQQFFDAVENEENGELSTFDGSLPQTLMMMNGELVQKATDPKTSPVLREILTDRSKSETERINELCLAALSRYPTKSELESIRKMLRNQLRQMTSRNIPVQVAYTEAMRDVYWAYLNSSEFSVNR